jgi:predicted DNA-binding protein
MTEYNKQLSIYLNDELKERLDAIGYREGTKLSATVRWLVIRAIKLYEKGEL